MAIIKVLRHCALRPIKSYPFFVEDKEYILAAIEDENFRIKLLLKHFDCFILSTGSPWSFHDIIFLSPQVGFLEHLFLVEHEI